MKEPSIPLAQLLDELQTSTKSGLSAQEAEQRQRKLGKNALQGQKRKGFLRKLLEQFSNFMVLVLIAAAGISMLVGFLDENGDFVDPIIILAIVVANAVIGVIQESRAERAIEALQKMSAPESRVLRDGIWRKVPSEALVPGDIIAIERGDCIPADARLISANALQTEESALTGEAFPVEKSADAIVDEAEGVAEWKNTVLSGSNAVAGNGTAVVFATGMQTQVGQIAKLLTSGEEPQTPLQIRLAKTGKVLGIAAMAICALIFVLGLIQQLPATDMLLLAVSLAVAAIPEGLPAVVTIVLAFGVRKMAQKQAIVRRLPAVETLGSAGVICSDKTGTLTQNRMTAVAWANDNGSLLPEEATQLMHCAVLCSHATVRMENGIPTVFGAPTESAMVDSAIRAGISVAALRDRYPTVQEIPFDSTRKRMVTVHSLPKGGYRIYVKGAPEQLWPLCKASETGQPYWLNAIERQNEHLASRALRVIGLAYRDCAILPLNPEQLEKDLIFLGLCGLIDPPRPEAKEAVSLCRRAGIRPVMITGDYPSTAVAIARDLGILRGKERVLTGREISALTDEALAERLKTCTVFARVTPEHKVRIVRAFQAQGAVVAMTGDGVNDAPALRAADIGCAMGSGTDVAKNAADMILTDDNFATIVSAVGEGRGITDNIRKAIHFLLSSNMGEIMVMLVAFLLRIPTPLLAIQLLWVNLVTDSLPALALGVEPKEADIMHRKPMPAGQSLFSGGLWRNILLEGAMIGSLGLLAFVIGRTWFGLEVGRTMTFSVLSISQLVHALNMRSSRSLFRIGLFSNLKMTVAFVVCLALQIAVVSVPALAGLFKTVPLNGVQSLIVAGLSVVPLIALELEKAQTAQCA